MISVDPAYQRRGIGSLLMQWGCHQADHHGWTSYVLSSPAGVKLYTNFGFTAVGRVDTERGTFTSMMREGPEQKVQSSQYGLETLGFN